MPMPVQGSRRRLSVLDNLEQLQQEALEDLVDSDEGDADDVEEEYESDEISDEDDDEEEDFVDEVEDDSGIVNFDATGGVLVGSPTHEESKDEMDIDEDEARDAPGPLGGVAGVGSSMDYNEMWSQLEYGWQGGEGGGDDNGAGGDSASGDNKEQSLKQQIRGGGRQSIHSPIIPEDGEGGDVIPEQREMDNRRSAAIPGGSAHGAAGVDGIAPSRRRMSHRRQTNKSVYDRSSMMPSGAGVGSGVGGGGSNRGSVSTMMNRLKSRHFSTRRFSRNSSGGSSSDARDSLHFAADALKNNAESGDFASNVKAAAMAVAAGAAQSKRSHVQFAVGDKVLAFLILLNYTNQKDGNDNFSVKPVNKFGYPQGEGRTEREKSGPFSYVMCTIKKVHFDEDERYFTVVRADTGTEQRAEAVWLEPLKDQDGIDAATRAAIQTAKAVSDKEAEGHKSLFAKCSDWAVGCVSWPLSIGRKLLPSYKSARALTKAQIMDLLFGHPNYSCVFRVSGINILVFCSLIFLFIDVVPLAFFPADWDYGAAVVGAVVWAILAIELFLEFLIRPESYSRDMEGDKAYAPSTARNINAYHLIAESIALIFYAPSFACLHTKQCGSRQTFLPLDAALDAVDGVTVAEALLGRFVLGITSLRLYGLVRRWKQMWINHTFAEEGSNKSAMMLSKMLMIEYEGRRKKKIKDDDDALQEVDNVGLQKNKVPTEEDQRLKNAATIGTALMVVTSHRALFLLTLIVTVFPMLFSFRQQNHLAPDITALLQENNLKSITDFPEDCRYLEIAVRSWVRAVAYSQPSETVSSQEAYVLWAQVLPVRCDFQGPYGIITDCDQHLPQFHLQSEETPGFGACQIWNETRINPANATAEYFAEELNLRVGGIRTLTYNSESNASFLYPDVEWNVTDFNVTVIFNQNFTVSYTNMSLFILLSSIIMLALVGLTTLRDDAGRLVLDPLRRMLKIVVRYAEDPLSNTVITGEKRRKSKSDITNDKNEDDESHAKKQQEEDQLGNYETEQLINAVAKIADLLRKCWGVAGADIIKNNLARDEQGKTVVFNPTVPGKRVYALFGFVAINGFSKQLHVLGSQVMILINDVAKVVHEEVYRWALNNRGHCNKNLGAAFLMVFRIGDFKDVHDRLKISTGILFGTQKKIRGKERGTPVRRRGKTRGRLKSTRHLEEDNTLQLKNLPGIQSFTDRALLGMLKSFAGIHRDKNLLNWSKDFRLGAGVNAYYVDIIYGMDAGWAVEGAVGSEYKIDATYLSPHVNMASRMMSASKQYGVTILVSQAVEELLSKEARSKMRHLDTVYVKGSIVPQRVFTYDARHKGVGFFLLERTPDQADADAKNYNTDIWEKDEDLKAMRIHVNEEFMTKFKEGVDQYLKGDWKRAVESLMRADDLMIEAVLEEGYVDYDLDNVAEQLFDRKTANDEITRLRSEYGDGACKCLIQYMERRKCVAPKDWHGVRKLESK